MSVEVDGKMLFTKEMTSVSNAEVIMCPDCGFEFSTAHDLNNNDGVYQCPYCNEENLNVETFQLKEKIYRYEKALETILYHYPTPVDFELDYEKAYDEVKRIANTALNF
jgi:DNA-directed RNA polymerase subunit RPC12/RpoP